MGKILLITRPEHDTGTRYLSRWSERIIDEAKNKGVRIIDLHKEQASRKRFLGTLTKSNAFFFFYLVSVIIKMHEVICVFLLQ